MAGCSRNAFVFYVSACFLKLLPTKRGDCERAFRWPSLKCSPPVSDVIYYLKRSEMFRRTERRLKNDKMKLFYPYCFFLWSFQSKQGIYQSGRGNKVWKHNWWVCSQCVCAVHTAQKILYYNIIQPLASFTYILTFTCLECLKRGTII